MRRPDQAAAQRSRRTEKQRTERQRRAQRELEQVLRERAERFALPRNDDGPPPRID